MTSPLANIEALQESSGTGNINNEFNYKENELTYLLH